jgi:hypothetical protein
VKVAATVVAFAALSAVLEIAAFHAPLVAGLTSTGSPDAIAALVAFNVLVAFTVALAVSIAEIIAISLIVGGDVKYVGSAALAGVLLLVVGFCAAALSPVTFLVPLALYAVLFIYTIPAVFVRKRSATAALLESCRIAAASLGPTLALAGAVAVVGVAGAWIGSAVERWSEFTGWFLAGLAQQGIVAFAALVMTRRLASPSPDRGL